MIAPFGANDVIAASGKSDVAPVGRNDAMFAHHVPQHTLLPQAASLAKPTSFAR